MTEQQHHETLIQWINLHPWHKFVFHIANEQKGGTNVMILNKLKRMGMKKGVSDLFFMLPRAQYHGLFFELKATNKKPNESQYAFMDLAQKQGYCAHWSDDLDCSMRFISNYLELK
jgi:hypothetical protein